MKSEAGMAVRNYCKNACCKRRPRNEMRKSCWADAEMPWNTSGARAQRQRSDRYSFRCSRNLHVHISVAGHRKLVTGAKCKPATTDRMLVRDAVHM